MILEKIKAQFLDDVLKTSDALGELSLTVRPSVLKPLMTYLKKQATLDFNVLMDVTAVDYLPEDKSPRFEVVYHLYSLKLKHRLRVKAGVDAKDSVASMTSLWASADWFEREVWDMFGITFQGHPNLKRILMYDGFEGHPLRKDYPIEKRQPLIEQAELKD